MNLTLPPRGQSVTSPKLAALQIACDCGAVAEWRGPRDGRREFCCARCYADRVEPQPVYRGFAEDDDYIHSHEEENVG